MKKQFIIGFVIGIFLISNPTTVLALGGFINTTMPIIIALNIGLFSILAYFNITCWIKDKKEAVKAWLQSRR